MSRPLTLAEAADRIRDGVPSSIAIPEFLDSFYLAEQPSERLAMLEARPALIGDTQLDALFGGIAEYLAKQHCLPAIPRWVVEPVRFLPEPWFTSAGESDAMKEYLAFASPAEFRHRNIFTEAHPLRRASLPASDDADSVGPSVDRPAAGAQ